VRNITSVEPDQEYGRLVVLELLGKNEEGRLVWSCHCAMRLGGCGRRTTATSKVLTTGKKESCGCLAREHSAKANDARWAETRRLRALEA
jgi:hypothetical protein